MPAQESTASSDESDGDAEQLEHSVSVSKETRNSERLVPCDQAQLFPLWPYNTKSDGKGTRQSKNTFLARQQFHIHNIKTCEFPITIVRPANTEEPLINSHPSLQHLRKID